MIIIFMFYLGKNVLANNIWKGVHDHGLDDIFSVSRKTRFLLSTLDYTLAVMVIIIYTSYKLQKDLPFKLIDLFYSVCPSFLHKRE